METHNNNKPLTIELYSFDTTRFVRYVLRMLSGETLCLLLRVDSPLSPALNT